VNSATPRLHPIQVFGRFGYIDGSGHVVVEPTLSCARDFRDGRGAARPTNRWGYVDATGNFVIEPRFFEVEDFYDGFAVAGRPAEAFAGGVAVGSPTGAQGVIDRRGAWVVEPRWDRVVAERGRFRVEQQGACGWRALDGSSLAEPRWTGVIGATHRGIVLQDAAGPALLDLETGALRRLPAEEARSPGVDTIPARVGQHWGLLDFELNWVVPPTWDFIQAFVDDRAVVRRVDAGLIDRSGRLVLPTTHLSLQPWPFGGGAGRFALEDARGHWLVDANGTVLWGPWQQTLVTGDPDCGLVRGASGWGAIAPSGKLLIEPTCEALADAGEGMLAVREGTHWGFIDLRAGSRTSLEPRFKRPVLVTKGTSRRAEWSAVRDTLQRLKTGPARVFGARGNGQPEGGHGFLLGPRLAEEQVASLEAAHRLTLPEQLRSFLMEVGNGPAAAKASGGAGPGHGLYEISEALADGPRAHEPFDPTRARASWPQAGDEDAVPPGLVVLGTHGCAFDYGIVVTGPFAGTMWSFVDPGWLPSTTSWGEILSAHHDDDALAQAWAWEHVHELTIGTFADEYLAWLDVAAAADHDGGHGVLSEQPVTVVSR
jgi:hypothetical protein